MPHAKWTNVGIMQATEAVGNEIRAELTRRRMSVETFAATVTVPGTTRTVFSFRTLCRRLAEPGTFSLDELYAISEYFGMPLGDLVTPPRRAVA